MASVFANISPKTGKREPTVVLLGVARLRDEQDQRDVESTLIEMCRSLDADGVIIAAECWMREIHTGLVRAAFPEAPEGDAEMERWLKDNAAKVRAAFEPFEAVQIIAEYRQEKTQHLLRFTRNDKGEPVPGEWTDWPGLTRGRFVGLLPGARGN